MAILCVCFSGFLVPSPWAQAPTRFPVTPEQVRGAMRGHNWPFMGVQIRLAAPVTATVGNPELEIVSVSPASGHEALLRVRCRLHTECIPFFASAVWPPDTPTPSLSATPGAAAPGSRAGRYTRDLALAAHLLVDPADASASPVIQAGTPATLLLEGAHVHIQLPVIFAQPGHVGDTVRVTTPNRRRTYIAEVLTPQLLKGEF